LPEYDRDQVEQRLNEREEEITLRRAQLENESRDMNAGELANYDQHPADQGTETFEQQMDETTVMVLDEELTRVKDARQALENGTYGTCADCGKEIPPARLEAMPEATRCVEDQSRYEARLRAAGPPPQDI
jgi:RNA polymerase-binding transcription factor DksA